MKVKSKLSGVFQGLGEIVAPFERQFPNVGSVVTQILKNVSLECNLIVFLTENGGANVYSCEPESGETWATVTTSINSQYGIAGESQKTRFTASKSGSAWHWSERANNATTFPFGSEAVTAGTLVNRLINRPADSDIVASDTVCVYVLQTIGYVLASNELIESDILIQKTLIAQFEGISSSFGE